jgi:exodeoxyribonuclease VII large subunit
MAYANIDSTPDIHRDPTPKQRAIMSLATPAQDNERAILSVTQLNRQARQLLETHLSLLWIEGEVSNFSCPSSGHWYFTLKDAGAQVRCAMFKNRNNRVRNTPQQGSQVLVRARVSLYEGRGDYQLIVEHMEDAGVGALQRAYEDLKYRLHMEGLFEHNIKQALPMPPRHLGVITSPTGAAVRDILHVLARRYPSLPVSIFPVPVQGADAAPQIVKALATANRLSEAHSPHACDLLIVSRGGGSLEDLWPFNEESVARAIFASRIPVISAVGHEVDLTIADYVADMRAPTPSAAAEIATPDGEALVQQFAGFEVLLKQALARKLRHSRERLEHLRARLQHPGDKLQAQAQQLDNLDIRLNRAMQNQLQQQQARLSNITTRQQALHPQQRLQQLGEKLMQLQARAQRQIQQTLTNKRHDFEQQAALLNSVSPLNTLQRGYSITRNEQGAVIHKATQLQPGDKLTTRLLEGEVVSKVASIKA